jgi:hypothetical protein
LFNSRTSDSSNRIELGMIDVEPMRMKQAMHLIIRTDSRLSTPKD